MTSCYRFRGLLVIALWQTVPVGVDESGRTRVGFGVGAGTMEFANYSCEGDLIDAQTVGYRTAGVEAEHWLGDRVRAHGAAGYQWSDSLQMKGPMGALMLSYEGRRFGIGGGAGFVPSTSYEQNAPGDVRRSTSELVPTIYLRGGNHEALHVRLEVFTPTVQTPGGRLVLGFNQFNPAKPSFAAGLGVFGYDGGTAEGAVLDYFQPVSPRFALGLSAYAGSGEHDLLTGVTLRGRFTLR